ncbi:MAG: ATP-grasp domain-containing protein, partial [Planctomycetota bacterium]
MTKSNRVSTGSFGVLFTCIGRRVSLLNSFRRAAKQMKLKVSFLGTDKLDLSPALQLCDKKFITKSVGHPSYITELLKIVKNNRVKLLVPTVDLDLKILSKNKSKFEKLGCFVLVSQPGVINICQDKRKTYQFLTRNGFDTPVTMSVRTALVKRNISWPRFLKPWDGYASRGNAVVRNLKELLFYSKKVPNCIVQEFVDGTEYTCDVYVDFDMKARCVVPRKRIEVRAGEVSKGQVVKDAHIMNEAAGLVEKLTAGPGVITLQLFLNHNDKVKFIEINPRFGGGVPLSIKAGADFPKWILQEITGRKTKISFDGFKDNLV